MNHGLFAPIEKIKKSTRNLDSKTFSPSTPSSSFLSCKSNNLSYQSGSNVGLDDKSKYATILSSNQVVANQRSSHFFSENKIVESIQSNLEKINILKSDLEKKILKYNENKISSHLIVKPNKLKTSSSAGRSKSIPQKFLNSERKKFTKSSKSDIYKSLLLNQQSKMILNQLSMEKNAAKTKENEPISSSSALNNLKSLITYSSSSSASNSSSSSTSTSTSINYSGKKPVDSPSRKTSLLSLKSFHLKIPKFNSCSNSNANTENGKTIVTQTLSNTKAEASCVNNEEKISNNLEIAKQKDSTGMC